MITETASVEDDVWHGESFDEWAREGEHRWAGDEWPEDVPWPDPPDALDLVVEAANVMSAFAADRLQRVAALRDDTHAAARVAERIVSTEIIDRSLRLELASALRITEHAAGELLGLAAAVVHRYPPILSALRRADITERHATILVAGVDAVHPELRDSLLVEGLELARAQPVGSFRRLLRALIETRQAQTLDERHALAVRARRVVIEATDDGMAWLHALLPAVEAHAIHGRITRAAKVLVAQDDETRSLDEARADVLCDLLIDGTVDSHPDSVRGVRATVVVTVPALALLEGAAAGGVAIVEGVGPIPFGRARELCGGADDWMRVLARPRCCADS